MNKPTPPQKEIKELRNKVKDTLINFNAYMHEDNPKGETIMVDYDRFTDEIMQVFHQKLLSLREEMIGEMGGKKKEYPPNIKQEMWGGEGGFS